MRKAAKIVTFVPVEQADQVRQAMGDAGAGSIGNYEYCTFSSVGTGRFLPQKGANPVLGRVGELEQVREEKIETVCEPDLVEKVIDAIKSVHPYEEVAIEVYQIELTESKND